MLSLKRILSIVAATMLAFACMAAFAGCGSGEPQNAKDVFARCLATNPDNCNMKGSIDIKAGVAGINMNMPITLDCDINGKDSHGVFTAEILGVKASGEAYTDDQGDKTLMYAKAKTSGSMFGMSESSEESDWTVSEIDTSTLGDIVTIDESLLDNAAFEKTDDGYLVSIKGTDVYAFIQNVITKAEGETEIDVPEIPQEAAKFIDELALNFTFDNDFKLTEITIPETKATITSEGQNMDVTVSCDIVVSKHGQIGEIVVPDDVVNSAVAETDLGDISSALNGEGSASAADSAEASEPEASSEAAKAA